MELKTGAWRRCCRLAEIVFTSPWLIPTVAVGLIGWGTLRLASSSSDSAPEVSSPRALDAKHVFPNGAAIRNLVLSADGESLDVIRSGHSADEIAEWQRISAHTGRELQHRPLSRSRLHRTQLTGKNFWAAVDHRGHLLASNEARPLWEGRLPQQADGESVVQVALCAEPQRIAAVSDQGTLWVLDWSATAVDVRGCYSLGQPISRLAFTTEGKRLAIATAEQKFLVWDVAQEKIVAQFAADGVEFQFVTWSDNGRRALAYDFDHAAIVWDAETGQKVE